MSDQFAVPEIDRQRTSTGEPPITQEGPLIYSWPVRQHVDQLEARLREAEAERERLTETLTYIADSAIGNAQALDGVGGKCTLCLDVQREARAALERTAPKSQVGQFCIHCGQPEGVLGGKHGGGVWAGGMHLHDDGHNYPAVPTPPQRTAPKGGEGEG